MTLSTISKDTARAAALSQGTSDDVLIVRVAQCLWRNIAPGVHTILDLGCGKGNLARVLAPHTSQYVGIDLVPYAGFPVAENVRRVEADLNRYPLPWPDGGADAVVAIETIEHLENPRAFARDMVRMLRPGGLLILTTPNQVSWLSKLALLCKNQFTAFQEAPGLYPSHISALLPIDLLRLARENGLEQAQLEYSGRGRLPGSARHYPAWLSRCFPRGASDNVMLSARKPPLPAR